MKTVQYRCRKCGYSEEYKKRHFITFFIKEAFAAFGIFIFLGSVVAYFYFDNRFANEITEYGVDKLINKQAKENDDALRELAINLTSSCDGGYSRCYSWTLYQELKDLRYLPTSKYQILYNPMYTYNNGGDCKNTALLYTSLMNSLGFDAEVVCSYKYKHCVSKVPMKDTIEKDYEYYVVVDIANSEYVIMNQTEELWSYMDFGY